MCVFRHIPNLKLSSSVLSLFLSSSPDLLWFYKAYTISCLPEFPFSLLTHTFSLWFLRVNYTDCSKLPLFSLSLSLYVCVCVHMHTCVYTPHSYISLCSLKHCHLKIYMKKIPETFTSWHHGLFCHQNTKYKSFFFAHYPDTSILTLQNKVWLNTY